MFKAACFEQRNKGLMATNPPGVSLNCRLYTQNIELAELKTEVEEYASQELLKQGISLSTEATMSLPQNEFN